jgi:cytochrome c-type biogenesis protein CcmH
MLVFCLAAIAMLALALALLLFPLIRHGRRHGRSPKIFALALLIALLLPLATAGIYSYVGSPMALEAPPWQRQGRFDMVQALAELRNYLAAHPDDIHAWMLLGQAYDTLQQPDQARDAYTQVLRRDAHSTIAMLGWIENDAALRPNHAIQASARKLLEQVLRQDPHNQRALWLLGIAQRQAGQRAMAASTWRRLLALLPPHGAVATLISRQIAMLHVSKHAASITPPAAPTHSTLIPHKPLKAL